MANPKLISARNRGCKRSLMAFSAQLAQASIPVAKYSREQSNQQKPYSARDQKNCKDERELHAGRAGGKHREFKKGPPAAKPSLNISSPARFDRAIPVNPRGMTATEMDEITTNQIDK